MLLRGTAAFAVTGAFADGCVTSVRTGRPPGGGTGEGGAGSSGIAGAFETGEAGGGDAAAGSEGNAGSTGGAAGGGGRNGGMGGAGGVRDGGGANEVSDAAAVEVGHPMPSCFGVAKPAGNASRIAMGSLVDVGGDLAIGRDSGGLYAMSMICSHQGCATNIVGTPTKPSLHCPCHGSTYNAVGEVTHGPAVVSLLHFQLDISANGDLTACFSAIVPITTRTVG
jgi:Rieske Fe-S protein